MEGIPPHVAQAAACCLFALSIVTDLRRRLIPNAIPILLLTFFAAYVVMGGIKPVSLLWEHLAVGGVILAASLTLYATGRFGGGDVKLLAVAGLWIGPSPLHLSFFLFSMAAFSFALSLFSLLPFGSTRRLRSQLPFAVAIAPPAILVLTLRALSDGV